MAAAGCYPLLLTGAPAVNSQQLEQVQGPSAQAADILCGVKLQPRHLFVSFSEGEVSSFAPVGLCAASFAICVVLCVTLRSLA